MTPSPHDPLSHATCFANYNNPGIGDDEYGHMAHLPDAVKEALAADFD